MRQMRIVRANLVKFQQSQRERPALEFRINMILPPAKFASSGDIPGGKGGP